MAPPTPPSQKPWRSTRWPRSPRSASRARKPSWAADAPAGATNIKVTSVANISVGDKIRLDIDSVGHGIETVTVTNVGTQASRTALAADASAGATNIKVRNANGFAVGDKMTVGTPANQRNGYHHRRRRRESGRRRRRLYAGPRQGASQPRVCGSSGHGPRPGRPAEVQPCGQPPLQRSGNGDQLPAGDGLCPLEQRARPAARHRHHARQPAGQGPRDRRGRA